MTKDKILADLDYASSLARDGANTPLLGGPIGLMWGVLLTLIFLGQWAILSGTAALPPKYIWVMWLAFAIIGGLGSAILGKKIDQKPGSNSVANRVESYVWVMFSGFAATLFIGVVLNMVIQGSSTETFDFLVVAAFAAQGLAYGVVAKLTNLKWIHIASFTSFAASAICFAMLGSVNIYLFASIGAALTIIIPSLITMKNEPKNV